MDTHFTSDGLQAASELFLRIGVSLETPWINCEDSMSRTHHNGHPLSGLAAWLASDDCRLRSLAISDAHLHKLHEIEEAAARRLLSADEGTQEALPTFFNAVAANCSLRSLAFLPGCGLDCLALPDQALRLCATVAARAGTGASPLDSFHFLNGVCSSRLNNRHLGMARCSFPILLLLLARSHSCPPVSQLACILRCCFPPCHHRYTAPVSPLIVSVVSPRLPPTSPPAERHGPFCAHQRHHSHRPLPPLRHALPPDGPQGSRRGRRLHPSAPLPLSYAGATRRVVRRRRRLCRSRHAACPGMLPLVRALLRRTGTRAWLVTVTCPGT